MSEGLSQGLYVVARLEFEPETFQTQGMEPTTEPPHYLRDLCSFVIPDTKSSSSVFDRLGQELTVDKAPTKASARLMVAGTAQVEKVNKDKATTVNCLL